MSDESFQSEPKEPRNPSAASNSFLDRHQDKILRAAAVGTAGNAFAFMISPPTNTTEFIIRTLGGLLGAHSANAIIHRNK